MTIDTCGISKFPDQLIFQPNQAMKAPQPTVWKLQDKLVFLTVHQRFKLSHNGLVSRTAQAERAKPAGLGSSVMLGFTRFSTQ